MKPIRTVINFFVFLSVAAIILMLLITVGDVIGRRFFARPIMGATEICEILMSVILTAMGGSLLAKKTVQVDILLDALPAKVSRKIDYGVLAISAVYCFIAAYATIAEGRYSMDTGRLYIFLRLPKWPFQFLLAFSFIVAGISAVLFVIMVRQSRSDEKKESIMDHAELAILKGEDD